MSISIEQIEKDLDAGKWVDIKGQDCTLCLEKRPSYCDRGRYTVKVQVPDPTKFTVDGADMFPRYYFRFSHMILEMYDWLKARDQLVESFDEEDMVKFTDSLRMHLYRVGQGLKDSEHFISIFTEEYMKDPLCLVQLGMAVMLDKPIFLMVEEGMWDTLPKNLKAIAKGMTPFKKGDRESMIKSSKELLEYARNLKGSSN